MPIVTGGYIRRKDMTIIAELKKPLPELLKEINDDMKSLEAQVLRDQLREKTKKVDEASQNFHREYREFLIMYNRLTLLEGKLAHMGKL